jgi:hypothetical protein
VPIPTAIQAVSVLSFQALAHIIALCTAMPLLHSLFIRYLHDSEHANLLLMKVCVLLHRRYSPHGVLKVPFGNVHWYVATIVRYLTP